MSDTEQWVWDEQGNITRTFPDLTKHGEQVTFTLRPPTMADVEAMGTYAYEHPGNELGSLMAAVCRLLVMPKGMDLEQFRALDAQVGMEVIEALAMFPVFDKVRKA